MGKKITLSYASIRSWEAITLTTLISILVIVGIFYLHPSNIYWYEHDNFSIINLLQFVFIDQYLIELITTTIISNAIFKYANIFKIHTLFLNFKGVSSYFLKFVPLFLIIYFFTSPFSVGIRYLYHYYVLQRHNIDYFNDYFFLNKNLYLSYLLPIIIISVLLLTVAILKAINKNKQPFSKEKFTNVSLKVKSEIGEKIISSKNVSSITREGRKYFVKSGSDKYRINKTLTELEKELDLNFITVNRSTIINLTFFKEYSFWENEKYIIRMIDGFEFNITRERLKSLKERLDLFHKRTYEQDA